MGQRGGTGDKFDGGTVSSITFCEEGLNDAGQLAFVANLDDPNAPFGFRTVVIRATLKGQRARPGMW